MAVLSPPLSLSLSLPPHQTSVSEEVRQVLKEVEEEQSYEEVVLLRRLVMTRIKKKRDLAEVLVTCAWNLM